LGDGGVRGLPIGHFHEREAARLAALAIGYDLNTIDSAKLPECGLEIRLRSIETYISNENIGHTAPSSGIVSA
jgi:hypothetical protein